jgi:uncharacterized iron-regulated membrane protein
MTAPNDKRPKNWLLIQFRHYHTTLGVALAVFIVLVCVTGIYLNHKDLFQAKPPMSEAHADPDTGLTPSSELGGLAVDWSRAMELAALHLGRDQALDHIQLKQEHGRLVYKIKTPREPGPERELIVDARTGQATLRDKGGYGLTHVSAAGRAESGLDWGRLMNDLHTGKFFGGWVGKLLIDLTSLTLLVLTLSGVYLWWVPIYRKRKNAKAATMAPVRPAAARSSAAPV